MDRELTNQIYSNKRIRLLIIAAFLLVIIYFLYLFITRAHISIKTNSQANVISLIKINKDGSHKTLTTSSGKELHATITGGSYEISVLNKQSGITKDIAVKARQSKNFELDIPPPIEPVSVLPNGATALAADAQQIYYFDPAAYSIFRLDANGIPQATNSIPLASAQWANTAFGVAQDNNGQLYVINNGSVSAMSVPFNYQSGSNINYSVSPGGMVYVSRGGTVYSGQNGNNFKKFYSASGNDLSLFASNSGLAVAVASSPASNSRGPNEGSKKLIIFNVGGQQIASARLDIAAVSWSPSGDKLVASDSSGVSIYSSSLHKIASVSNSGAQVAWVNNDAFVYGQGSGVWQYDVIHQQAVLLSSTPSGESISNIFVSDDENYVYFSADSSDGQSHILLRVGLNAVSNNVPAYYSGLSVFFPDQTQSCSLSYSDFNQPFLIINGWSDSAYCHTVAETTLQTDGLPVGGFNIVLTAQNSFNE